MLRNVFSGHHGIYPILDPNGGDFNRNMMFGSTVPRHDGVARFPALHHPPFVFAEELKNNSFSFSVSVSGLYYSILVESVQSLNYSLKADLLDTTVAGGMWERLFTFRPEFFFAPCYPIITPLLNAVLEMNMAKFTTTIGVTPFDHILSLKNYVSQGLFNFLSAFELSIWIFVLIAIAGMSLVMLCSFFYRNGLFDARWRYSIAKYIFFIVVQLWAQPEARPRANWLRILWVSWSFGCLFLQWLFADDMIAALTMGPEKALINNFEDLSKTGNTTITAFLNPNENYRIKYFRQDSEFYESLTSRLELLRAERAFWPEVIDDVIMNVTAGRTIHLGPWQLLRFYLKMSPPSLVENVYISKEAQSFQPHLILSSKATEPALAMAFDVTTRRLQENGIYERWEAEYTVGHGCESDVGDDDDEERDEETTTLYGITGSFELWSMGLALGIISFLFEGISSCCQKKLRLKVRGQQEVKWAYVRPITKVIKEPTLSPIYSPRLGVRPAQNIVYKPNVSMATASRTKILTNTLDKKVVLKTIPEEKVLETDKKVIRRETHLIVSPGHQIAKSPSRIPVLVKSPLPLVV